MEDLMIEGRGFSDRGLAHLRGLTRLKSLSLGEGRHTITDAGLGSLEEMAELKRLDLSGWQVTDAGVDRLLGLKKLKTVSLGGTKVTEAGRRRLKAAGLTIE
jgi:hypothetical protein